MFDVNLLPDNNSLTPSSSGLFGTGELDKILLNRNALLVGDRTPEMSLMSFPTQLNSEILPRNHSSYAEELVPVKGLEPIELLTGSVINSAVQHAQISMEDFLTSPNLPEDLTLAFGQQINLDQAEGILATLSKSSESLTHLIEILPQAQLNGANAGFDSLNGKIYLAQEFIAENSKNIAMIATAIVEETGHLLDSQINTVDSPGDEGEIFAKLVNGETLSEAEIIALKTENDLTTININGTNLLIEQSLPTTDQAWDIASGDNTRFDGAIWPGEVDERWRTSPELQQVYTNLSTAALGQRYRMTAGYAYDQSYRNGIGTWHAGIDIGASAGTSVRSVLGGRVAWRWSSPTAGAFIGINSSDGRQWVFGHLQGFNGLVDDSPINPGQVIGQVGNQSGAHHLHLEVRTPPFQGTNGGDINQNFILSATMSPLQAFWQARGSTPPPSGSSFRGVADGVANVRSGPGTSNSIVGSLSTGSSRTFDTVARGTTHWDSREQRNDDRWFRIQGTNQWVSAAFVTGNPVFTGTVDTTLNVRSGPGTSFPTVSSLSTGSRQTFDATTVGTTHWDTREGKNENRWFRIQGTDRWASAAFITGNPTY